MADPVDGGAATWERAAVSAAAGELGARSWAAGYLSCRPAHAVRAAPRAAASGSAVLHATSSYWVARPLIVDGDGHAARREREPPDGAWTGIEAEAGSTWTAANAETAAGRTNFCAAHAAMVTLLMRANWTVVYDMTLEGREVWAFERRPSCRRYLQKRLVR